MNSIWTLVPLMAGLLFSPGWAVQGAEKREVGLFSGIDGLLEGAIESKEAVGHSALVFVDGKVAYYGARGLRDAKQGLAVERDTIFRIYSMTKPVTSVAAMQLVERGKLALDDPVAKYLPEFANLTVWVGKEEEPEEPKRAMTVRDLLRHTSGLTYGFFGKTPIDKQYQRKGVLVTDTDLAGTVTKLSGIPLLRHPGVRWHYGVSTDVLGRVIEVAGGKTLREHFQSEIFDPLGMADTFFTVPRDKQKRLAEMYRPSKKGLTPSNAIESYRYLNENRFYSGGGGLCSTLDDYLKFCQALIGEGETNGHRLLKPESLEEMFQNQLESIEQSSRWFQFGLGFRIDTEYGDYSWGGAAGTRFWVHPEKGLVILYMVQTKPDGGCPVAEEVRSLVYKTLEDAK